MRIGICTDLHQDLIKDGEKRLQSFITEMNQAKPDFIIQMGDFCIPKEKNKNLMEIWNQFTGPKYHVIGNHDTDGGFTHDQVVDFWSAKGKYYSFDTNGYHFVVLNGNERPEGDTSKGYPRSINAAQIKWMKQDLEATSLPTIVFCHQGIDNDQDGLKEGALIRLIFERVNQKAGFHKVQFVFSGHHHEDYHNIYNGTNYVQINSISYQFTHPVKGYDFAHTKEPLWALLTIHTNGTAEIKGRKSEYMGQEASQNDPEYNGYPNVPYISDRVIKV
ncbi:metallophosphoesterase family protein [Pedobacter ginsengisoli]|uniref:metallophosphoesterase family protein n=1 Tax=Pedobacter ginsengisoli TaxID=363852 RepID=UPI0012FE4D1E|nr:metallophosphoesterase [Pedobacter ginsengisoli]